MRKLLYTVGLALCLYGCSPQPKPGMLDKGDAQLTRLLTKNDWPALVAPEIVTYKVNTKTGGLLNASHFEYPSSVEVQIADSDEFIRAYYFDADASGDLLDHVQDKIVLYDYVRTAVLPSVEGETVAGHRWLKALTTTYGRDYFTSIEGVVYQNMSDPIMKAHYDQSRTRANEQNAHYIDLRANILPKEIQKRFK